MRWLRSRLKRLERRTWKIPVAPSPTIRPNHTQQNSRLVGGTEGQSAHRNARENLMAFLVADAWDRSHSGEKWFRRFQFVRSLFEGEFQFAIEFRLSAATGHKTARLLAAVVLLHLPAAHALAAFHQHRRNWSGAHYLPNGGLKLRATHALHRQAGGGSVKLRQQHGGHACDGILRTPTKDVCQRPPELPLNPLLGLRREVSPCFANRVCPSGHPLDFELGRCGFKFTVDHEPFSLPLVS